MTQTELLILALERWNREIKPKIASYPELLFHLTADLGCRWESGAELKDTEIEDYLRTIDERVFYLTCEQNIAEELIVLGAAGLISQYLSRPLAEREKDIQYFEKMLADADEVELIMTKIAHLKDPDYEHQARKELAGWQRLVEKLLFKNTAAN